MIPLGIEPDRGSPLLSGAINEGWEVWGSLPAVLAGLRLEGSVQQWQRGLPICRKEITKLLLYSNAASWNRVIWGFGGPRLAWT
ncbi:MAG: hypothetical protein CM1200mP14_23580 [Gammaproteobacteria bacterium]|nr:MAG: hypothetical protein CM1200mP14_23580 [Gammaproteobacteria bacterium]